MSEIQRATGCWHGRCRLMYETSFVRLLGLMMQLGLEPGAGWSSRRSGTSRITNTVFPRPSTTPYVALLWLWRVDLVHRCAQHQQELIVEDGSAQIGIGHRASSAGGSGVGQTGSVTNVSPLNRSNPLKPTFKGLGIMDCLKPESTRA